MKAINSLLFLFVVMFLFSCKPKVYTVKDDLPPPTVKDNLPPPTVKDNLPPPTVKDNLPPLTVKDDLLTLQVPNSIISLVPISPEAPKDYCRFDFDLNLGFIMLFQNSGGRKSTEIQGAITFSGSRTRTTILFTIPEIPAKVGDTNGFAEVIVQIPHGCFSPDCSYTIQWADRTHSGTCIG